MLHIQFRPIYFSTSFDLSFFDQTFSTWLYVAEQEQRPSGNGDREAIVVGAGLCDGEGERA